MDEDDLPALVFAGEYAEVVFLVSLLEASGIETWHSSMRVHYAHPPWRLFVRKRAAADARAIVEDFERNGKRTSS